MNPKRNSKMIERARDLRKGATKQERRLWYEFLREYPIHFRRQAIFDHYIVDFYCADAKLIVELDGSQHYEAIEKAYDEHRTAVLNQYGCQVLRFSNLDVDDAFSSVCEMIDLTVRQRLKNNRLDES